VGGKFKPLEEAREYVLPLKLTNYLPADPYYYKKENGWKGISDFLGSTPSPKYVEMCPFRKARRKLTSPANYSKWAQCCAINTILAASTASSMSLMRVKPLEYRAGAPNLRKTPMESHCYA
jgi:hypothetical protein